MDRIGQAVGNYQQCYAELAAARVEFSPMPDRDDGTGCAYADAGLVTVDWGTVARLNPAQPLLSCPAALALSIWRRQVVEPAARDIFGSDVVQIDLMGAYSCRNVNGAATGPAQRPRPGQCSGLRRRAPAERTADHGGGRLVGGGR
jgi:hypothetical protein